MVTGNDPGREAVPAHGLAVALAAVGRDRTLAAVHESDVAVAEAGEVADRLGHALVVGGTDHVDAHAGRVHPAADDHNGKLVAKGAEPVGLVLRAEQDERLAAKVEQDLGRAPLVPGRRGRAEHQVVAEPGGGRVDVRDELGMEGIPDIHGHAEVAAAPPGQQAGRPVRAVTELPGGAEHPGPGRFTRARLVAQHQRGQPGRNAGPGGHIGE